jgi:ORF6N domain-containing protein
MDLAINHKVPSISAKRSGSQFGALLERARPHSLSVWPRLSAWSRRINRMFVVICRVEMNLSSSRRRSHVTHELIGIPDVSVEDSILLIRSQKVILDRTLAKLYGVSTSVLNQAVRRNPERFPPDFMFQLTVEEAKALDLERSRSQIVILKKRQGKNIKYRPYAFTEHGILMLSSVLRSDRAIQVNIQIMRTFVRLREMLASNGELTRRLDELERTYDGKIQGCIRGNQATHEATGWEAKTNWFWGEAG